MRMATHARSSAASEPAQEPVKDPRERILAIADVMLYQDGIQQASVEEIATAAGVSRRVFAKNFASKEQLVVAYIDGRHERDARLLGAAAESDISHHLVFNMVLSEIIADVNTPGFRGCAFINAAAECPELADVQRAIAEHREWYLTQATELLRVAGHPHPADAAVTLMAARDEAMSSTYGDDATDVTAGLRHAMERVLSEIPDSDGGLFD
jgi:AcrR family transcriptional regulator